MPLEPVAVAFDVDHLAVVEQSVEDGGSDHGILEEFLPVGEALVGRDDGRTLFITVRDELEEEVGILGGHRQIAHFIDDDQQRERPGDYTNTVSVSLDHQDVHVPLLGNHRDHLLSDRGGHHT